jgi:hypothetical protein
LAIPSHTIAAVGINQTINYQGRLLNSAGAVVADGTYNMRFKIYKDGDGTLAGNTGGAPAGTLFWTEKRENFNTQGITVKNGYFSVALGSICAFVTAVCQTNSNTAVDFNLDTLFLSADIGGITAGASPAYDGEMLPMKRLAATPYALNAGKVGGLASSQLIQLAQGVQTDASTTAASIFINKTGTTANIFQLQRGGTDVLLVDNAGLVTFRPNADNANAIKVVNAANTEQVLSVDTTARSASGGNIVKIGNSTGTDTATTILQVDSTTTDPTTNLAALNGGLFYNSVGTSLKVITGGAVATVCTTVAATCNATYAAGTSASYIQNQNAGAQATSNFNISGSGTAATFTATTSMTSPSYTGSGAVSITSAAATALGIDSGTTGALNIGTGANAKTITIGNVTGATQIVNNSGTGGVIFNQVAGATSGISVTSGANIPTGDQLAITNVGASGVVTAGVNGLSINYKGGTAAVESAGQRIDLQPGTTSGGTWSALRLVPNATGAVAGVNEYGVKIDNLTTPGAGTESALFVGTGWDNIIQSANFNVAQNGAVTGLSFAGTHTGNGAGLTALDAGNISAGTLSVSRGGSGATNFAATNGSVYYDGTKLMSTAASTGAGQCLITVASGGVPSWGACGTTAVTAVGAYSTTNTAAGGATIAGSTITFQDASATAPGMLGTGAQVIAGAKTFSSIISVAVNGSTGVENKLAAFTANGAGAQYPSIELQSNGTAGLKFSQPNSFQDAIIDNSFATALSLQLAVRGVTALSIANGGASTFNSTLAVTTSVASPTYSGPGAVSLNSAAATSLTVDSGTTGALNIGTSANAKTITIGNVSGATQIVHNSGTGGVVFNQVAGATSGISVTSGANIPTGDQLNITNAGSTGVTTAGVNGLSVNYKGGAAAVESAATRIDLTPGTTAGGTWNGFRFVPNATGAVAGVTENGVKIDNLTTPGAGTENAISVGTGWDNILQYNGATVVIDGLGRHNLSQVFNILGAANGGTGLNTSGSTGVATVTAGTWAINASLAATLGGTGQTTYAVGDLLTGGAGNTLNKIAAVASGSCLISNGVATAPIWGACGAGASLQAAYTASGTPATITTSSAAKNIVIKSGVGFNSTGAFQVIADGTATPTLNVDTTNGRVGIGTAAPGYNLDVQGISGLNVKTTTNTTTAIQIQNSAGGNILTADTTISKLTVNQGSLSVNGISNPGYPALSSSGAGGTVTAGTYYYRLAALGLAGESQAVQSNAVSVTTAGSTSSNTLTWSAVTNATGYKLYRSTDNTNWFVNTLGLVTTAVDNGSNFTWGTVGAPKNFFNLTGQIQLTSGAPVYFDGGAGNVNIHYDNASSNGANGLVLQNAAANGLINLQSDQFTVQDTIGYNNNLVILNTGATTFKNRVDSIAAFQVKSTYNATALLGVDTTNGRVGINTDTTTVLAELSVAASSDVVFNANTAGAANNILQLQKAGVNVVTVANSGATTVKNASNSTTAFQIQNAAGTTLLATDTTNLQVNTLDTNVGSTFGNRYTSDNFESGNFAFPVKKTTGASTIAADTAQAHNGKYSAKMTIAASNTQAAIVYTIPSSSTLKTRAFFYATTWPSGGDVNLISTYKNGVGSENTLFRQSGTNKICEYTDATFIVNCSSTTLTATNTWIEIEFDVNINAATGSYNAYVNNTLVSGFGTANTNINTGNWLADSAALGHAPVNSAVTGTYWVDDFVVDGTSIGVNSSSLNVSDSLHVSGLSTFGSSVAVQNASGTNIISADANTAAVNIGSIGAPTGQLYVSGKVPSTAVGSVATTGSEWGVYSQGNYLYSAKNGTSLVIYDTSNPTAPVLLKNFTVAGSANLNSVYVQGHYAYVSDGSNGKLFIVDISNPNAPVLTNSITGTGSMYNVIVSGRYAYAFYGGGSIQIFDISNPASVTAAVSTFTPTGSTFAMEGNIVGKYLYVLCGLAAGNNKLYIYDVSNPSSPVLANTGGTLTGSAGAQGPYIQGRYAYVYNYTTTPSVQVFDIKDPTAPTVVGTVNLSAGGAAGSNSPNMITGQGRYVYVTTETVGKVDVVDVSTPTAPVLVGSIVTNSQPIAMSVVGRYAYVEAYAGNTIQVFDIGGAYAQQLETGGLLSATVSVTNGAFIGGDTSLQGGLTVGQTLQVNGDVGINGATNISGSLQIGSKTTDATQVNTQVDSSNAYADTGTCNATTAQGALYYNTASDSLRECEGANGWTEVATIKGLGILSYGVMADSGSNPGDLDSNTDTTNFANGPCEVHIGANTSTVAWNACTAYSSGRKVIVTAGSAATATGTANDFSHICLSGANGQPALSARGTETANLATVSMPSVTSPIVCLADIKYSGTAATITNIYDTRTYLNTQKVYATVGANTPALGKLSNIYSIRGQDFIPNAALNQGPIHGVIVATTGSTSTTTVNAIVAIAGPGSVKATNGTLGVAIGSSSTVGGYAENNSSTGRDSSIGIAHNIPAGAGTCTANTDICEASIRLTININ